MTTTAKPLNKRHRERAEKAKTLHAEYLRLQGAAGVTKAKRDAHVTALLSEGVRQFVVVNEAGLPLSTVRELNRKLVTGGRQS